MARFFGLVKNEYIKVFKKLSTKIMLGIIVLAAFGLSAIMLLIAKTSGYYEDNFSNPVDGYTSNIEWLTTTKPENYEARIDAYQYLIDNNITGSDWRINVVYALDEDGIPTEYFNDCLETVKANDVKSYFQFMLNNSTQEGDKWAYAYRIDNNVTFDKEFDQQNVIISDVCEAKNQLAMLNSQSEKETAEKTKVEDKITLGTYQLDNHIYENTANMSAIKSVDNGSSETTFWGVFTVTPSLVQLVGLLIIVIAGGSVASEFHQGTIKFLLINPVKRWKILMSKYLTCISIGYIMIAVTFVICIPAVGIFHGFSGMDTPYLWVEDGVVHEMSSFLNIAKTYLLNSISVVVMASLAFAISSLVRSSALAIGVSVFMMFAGNSIAGILSTLGQDWGRFLIFANTDLASIADGNSLFPQHTIFFALMVIAAHMAVFILTAWDGFTKRSV